MTNIRRLTKLKDWLLSPGNQKDSCWLKRRIIALTAIRKSFSSDCTRACNGSVKRAKPTGSNENQIRQVAQAGRRIFIGRGGPGVGPLRYQSGKAAQPFEQN